MRYISEADGEVFNTEHECLEHEREIEKNRLRKEKLMREQHERLEKIKDTYECLKKLVFEYGRDYSVQQELHFIPLCEFIDVLCKGDEVYEY